MIERIVEISHRVIELSSRILADAFQNDPLFKHALPDNRQRKKRLLALFACSLQYGDMFGEIYSASRQGLAIWLPPGNCRITVRQSLQAGKWLIPLKIGLQAALHLEKLHIVSESLHKRYAPDPHWYLFLLGIDPASQGHGLGGSLLQPVLARADGSHLPCYLETNNPSAVHFYQKHGFDIAVEQQTSSPDLSIWAMRRECR